jgi:hypothetical protein
MIAIAKDDLHLHPHTWTKGLDYQLIFKSDYVTVASNEGSLNFTGEAKERLPEIFELVLGNVPLEHQHKEGDSK